MISPRSGFIFFPYGFSSGIFNNFFSCYLLFSTFLLQLVCYSTATALATDDGYYERHIGQTALLKCVIEDCIPGAKCHVQWIHPDNMMMTHETKDSVAMMYGSDRYRIRDSNPKSPDWSLEIDDLQLKDDGVFRCNLFVDGTVTVFKSIKLVVLVYPDNLSPIIHGPANSVKSDGRMSVQEGEVSLKCLSTGGKPATRLRWERVFPDGNVVVLEETKKRKIVHTVVKKADKTADSYAELQLGVISVDEYDQAKFRCTGEYGTVKNPKTAETDLILDIQHPPSAPIMTVDESSGNNVGDRVQIKCSVNGGNPPPQVHWYFSDNPSQLLDGVTENFASPSSPSSSSSSSSSSPSTAAAITVSTLSVVLTRDVFMRHLVCDVRHKFLSGGHVTTNVTLPVNFGPARLHIIGAEANFKAGDRHVITCRTDPANPPWDVKWSIQDNPTFQTYGDPSVARVKTNKGFISESNITIDITRDDNIQNTRINCEAVGGIGTTAISATKYLKTMVAPDRVVMVTTPPKTDFREGDSVEIGCAAIGESHPKASVVLITASTGQPVGILLPASSSLFPGLDTTSGSRGRSVISLSRASNQVKMCCRVEHPVYNASYGKYTGPEDCRTFDVKFDSSETPSLRRLVPSPSSDVIKPDRVVLECETPSSNPPASVTWFCGNSILCDVDDYEIETPSFTEEVVDHGKRTRSTISFNADGKHDNLEFSCAAVHWMGNSLASNILRFRVQYQPFFPSAPAPSSGPIISRVLEGENKTFSDFVVKANPEIEQLRWMRKVNGRFEDVVSWRPSRGRAASNSLFDASAMSYKVDESRKNVFSLVRAHRSATGEYLITASNDRGQANLYFDLQVDYPPEFFTVPTPGGDGGNGGVEDGARSNYAVVYADEGENTTLRCGARANPVTRNMLTWRKPSTAASEGVVKRIYDLRGIEGSEDNTFVSTYFIPRVHRLDGGLYTCVGNNLLTNRDGKLLMTTTVVKLVVNYAPFIPSVFQRKFAAKRGSVGSLTCTARGAPSISFVWCRKGAENNRSGSSCSSSASASLTNDSSGRFSASTKRLGDDLWSSTLKIADISTSDFGSYYCTASNRLGCGGGSGGGGSVGRRSAECNVEMTLKPLSPPESPSNLSLFESVSSVSSGASISAGNNNNDKNENSYPAPSTSGSAVRLAWMPGFDGGLPQSFLIRFNEREVVVPESSLRTSADGRVEFELSGLEAQTEYRVSIAATNDKGHSGPSNQILVKTLAAGEEGIAPLQMAIIGACVGGGLLVLVNIVIIVVCIRRNKAKGNESSKGGSETTTDSATPPNGMELYEPQTNGSAGVKPYGTYSSYHNFSEHYGSIGSDKPDFDDYSAKQFPTEDSRYIRANGSLGYANGHLNGSQLPELINGHLPNGKGFLGSLPLRHTQTYLADDPYATMKSNHTTDRSDGRLDRLGSAGPNSPQHSLSTESGVAQPSIASTQRTDYVAVNGVTTGQSHDLEVTPQASPAGSHYDEMGQPPQTQLSKNNAHLGSSYPVSGRSSERPISGYGNGSRGMPFSAGVPVSASSSMGSKSFVSGLGTPVDGDLDVNHRPIANHGRLSPRPSMRSNGVASGVISPIASTPTRHAPDSQQQHQPHLSQQQQQQQQQHQIRSFPNSSITTLSEDNNNGTPFGNGSTASPSPLSCNPLLGSSEYLKPLHELPRHLSTTNGKLPNGGLHSSSSSSSQAPAFNQGSAAYTNRAYSPEPLPPPPPHFRGFQPNNDALGGHVHPSHPQPPSHHPAHSVLVHGGRGPFPVIGQISTTPSAAAAGGFEGCSRPLPLARDLASRPTFISPEERGHLV